MIRIENEDDTYLLIKYHDYFNIIILPFIFVSNCISLYFFVNMPIIFVKNFFDIYFYLFLSYISIDLTWILMEPRCVGHPLPIIVHHIICLIGWILSVYNEDFVIIARTCSLVELNTWFNILKRYFKNDIIYFMFYVTWFLFRLIILPYLSYLTTINFLKVYNFSTTLFQTDVMYYLFFALSSYSILILNLKWTWDLFTKKGYLGVSSKRD